MQTTSTLYKNLLAQPNTEKEWKAVIGGTEHTGDITELRIVRALFGDHLIGSTCSAILYLSMYSPGTIARMARVDISYRLRNGASSSEWVKRGSYWINNRSLDKDTGVLTLTCFDGMMFSEQDFYPIGSEITDWSDKTMREVAVMCSEKMGIALENAAQVKNAAPYIINAPPVGYSVRQVLAGIATAHCANWTMTADNKLRLVPLSHAQPSENDVLATTDGYILTFGGDRIIV